MSYSNEPECIEMPEPNRIMTCIDGDGNVHILAHTRIELEQLVESIAFRTCEMLLESEII